MKCTYYAAIYKWHGLVNWRGEGWHQNRMSLRFLSSAESLNSILKANHQESTSVSVHTGIWVAQEKKWIFTDLGYNQYANWWACMDSQDKCPHESYILPVILFQNFYSCPIKILCYFGWNISRTLESWIENICALEKDKCISKYWSNFLSVNLI